MMRHQVMENALCLFIVLIALGIAAWVLITDQVAEQGIDALFLILVCLLIAFAFSLTPLQAIRSGLFRDLLKRREVKAFGSHPEQTPQTTSQQRQEGS